MKVIYIKDLKGKGRQGDIQEVSDGYAQNFLIKNGYAVKYTKTSSERLEQDIKQNQKEHEENTKQANQIKEKLENLNLKFIVKTGAQDKVFGSVSTKQIMEELNKKGYTIDKKNIKPTTSLSSLGYHVVNIILYKDVTANVKIELIKK